jgi:hypothetical protein
VSARAMERKSAVSLFMEVAHPIPEAVGGSLLRAIDAASRAV